ncbi:DUF4304 domain-containing protein [Heyndrickxia sp. NPDC080065]|uniref:DUF4304 domain-containing protein n=1 Tax=Heyndrickxia sp. NPDC080065 TaxID=3390568 RepID=UPI003D00E074
MNMQELLKQIIKEDIAPLFKAKGFKKKGKNFAKIFPDFAWTVNLQSSKWNTKEEVEFTFNTGIFTDKLFGTFYLEKPPQFPTEVYSVLRLRINELKNEPDNWYKISISTNLDEVKRKIQNDIQNVIFQHLEKLQTIEDVIKEMVRKEELGFYECPHFLTILYKNSGFIDESQNRINKVYAESKLDSQKEFIKELAERLELIIK